MDRNQVFDGVKKCLMDCIRMNETEIRPDARLIGDLGADSLDLLDIIFSLERHFNIKIKPGEIEKRAREGIPPEEFEHNNLLKPRGAERLREILPEIPSGDIQPGMHISQIPYLFTVETFIKIIEGSLNER